MLTDIRRLESLGGAVVKNSSCELLAVSFAYPPAASPRAVQVARLLKHLNARTTLVCAAFDDKDRIDPSLTREAESSLVHCLRVPFAPTGARNLLSRLAYRLGLPVVDKTPDQFGPWKHAVLTAVERFTRERDYTPDVLVTFGSPMSDHLIGLALNRRFSVPWIAHFSDPWVENPFLEYDRLTERVNIALEARVVKEADCLIFTSKETIELVMRKHPPTLKQKARVLPHSFDPDAFLAPASSGGSDVVIRHVGDFYGQRSPAPLFRALQRLLSSDPDTLSDVRFELVGSKGEGQFEEAGIEFLPERLVNTHPPVEYLESLRMMTSADGLVVVDAPAEVSVFLPSKLIDYVGAGRPIIGITPRGTAADLIKRLGGWVADPSDTGAVAAALKGFVDFLRANGRGSAVWGDRETRRGFEAPVVAEKFEEILREVRSLRVRKS